MRKKKRKKERKNKKKKNVAAQVLTRTKKVDHITPVLRSLHWLPVSQRTDFQILLLVYKALMASGQSTFLICCYVMNHQDLWGRQEQVCFQSTESKLNMEKQYSVIMRNKSGTDSQNTAGPRQLSPLLNQEWRPFCLPQPLIKATLRLRTFLVKTILVLSLVFKAHFSIFNLF